jgi:hypothetical protein
VLTRTRVPAGCRFFNRGRGSRWLFNPAFVFELNKYIIDRQRRKMSLTAPVAHPPLRHRASSTSLRPSLSPQKNQDGLCCRSNSFVVRQQPQESDPTSSSTTSGTTAMSFSPIEPIPRPLEAAAVTVSASDRTMVSLMLARVLQLLPSGGVRHDALELDSPLSSSSARSSTETILPLSAPPDKTSFGDIFDEKARSSSSSSSPRWRLRPSPKVCGTSLAPLPQA